MGTGKVSVAEEIAEVQRVLSASGLKHVLHSAGTTVGTSLAGRGAGNGTEFVCAEGSWTDVMTVIGKAHAAVHGRGVVRVQSSLRVGTRYVLRMGIA